MRCSVLQCDAAPLACTTSVVDSKFPVCCNVLQWVAMSCSALQCDAAHWPVPHPSPIQNLSSVAVCCNALQCVAVGCSAIGVYHMKCQTSGNNILPLFFADTPYVLILLFFCTDKARQKKQRLTVLNRYRRAKTLAEMRRFVC